MSNEEYINYLKVIPPEMEVIQRYAVLPQGVRYDKNLKDKSKLLYGEIYCATFSDGYCYKTNNYFADIFGVSKETISNLITELVDNGYITREFFYKKGTKEIAYRRLQCQFLE